MSVSYIGEFPLGAINVGLGAELALVVPLLSQFDLMITGQFGLGALLGDISAQLNAALSLQAQIGIQISDPFAQLEALIAAFIQIQAQVSVIIALGLPSLQINLSASLSISAALQLQLGGINLLIQAALAIKLPVVNIIAELQAALSAGPFVLLSVGYNAPSTLFTSGIEYQALTEFPIGSPSGHSSDRPGVRGHHPHQVPFSFCLPVGYPVDVLRGNPMAQPLFFEPDVHFEKVASEVMLPEDANSWPNELMQELFKQCPYIADFEPHVTMDRVDAERGFGFGHIEMQNKTEIQHGAEPEAMRPAGIKKARVSPSSSRTEAAAARSAGHRRVEAPAADRDAPAPGHLPPAGLRHHRPRARRHVPDRPALPAVPPELRLRRRRRHDERGHGEGGLGVRDGCHRGSLRRGEARPR